MSDNLNNQAEEFDLEDLMEDVSGESEESTESVDYDINILTEDVENNEGASDLSDSKDAESYSKNSNFNNSSDYLRKFSESFSTSFVLSPSFSGVSTSNYKQMKQQQDEKTEKLIKELNQNRPKPALLKKLAGK